MNPRGIRLNGLGRREREAIKDLERHASTRTKAQGPWPRVVNNGDSFVVAGRFYGRDSSGLIIPASGSVQPMMLALEAAATGEEFAYATGMPGALVKMANLTETLPAVGSPMFAATGGVTGVKPSTGSRWSVGRLAGTTVNDDGEVSVDVLISQTGT